MSSRFQSTLLTGVKSTASLGTSSVNLSEEGTQSGDISEVTAWQNEMDTLEQTQMKIQANQTNLMHSQIQILMREIGDLQKQVSWMGTRIDAAEDSLGGRVEDLAGKIETAMEEAHAALRLELAEHGNNAAEMKAAMEEAHQALATEMAQKQAEHAQALSEHAEAHGSTVAEMEAALRGDLQKLAEDHASSHAAHHEKHSQNAEALESGLQNVLESTHGKLQAELQALRSDGSPASLKDILADVVQQVDTITQSLEQEHELRMAVEVKLDQMCNELREDLEASFREAHAALQLELAEHGGNAADIKAAMEDAHAALRGELASHAEMHRAAEDALNALNDEHHEKHAQNAERFEQGLNDALGNTHAKLQEELKLLKGGGAQSLGDLSKIVADVTQQVDSLDQSLQKEHELRMAVEARMDKMFNDQDKVVCELHRDIKSALNESHAALKLELADLGKNGDEIKAAMYEAHKALQNEHGRVTGDLADKLDSHGQAHSASLAELENKLRSDLTRSSKEVDARHRDLKAANAKNEANHSTLDQRIHLLELSCSSKYDDSFKEVQSAHAKIQEVHLNMQNHKSKSDLAHAGTQERLETLERQLKERVQCHDALQGKFQGESLTRERGMSTYDVRLTKLEALFNESTERQAKDLEGAHTRVREALSKLEQQRSSLENHKSIVDQRLSYLDKSVLEAQDSQSQTFAQALSSIHSDHAKELTYALQSERAARESQEKTFLDFIQDAREQKEAFEQTMQEQIRLERVAREVQWNQLKDSIAIKEKMWQGGNSEYADILMQEHSAREAVERSIEHKVEFIERNLQTERSERRESEKRLWDALDTHTHDAITPSITRSVEVKPAESKPPVSPRFVTPLPTEPIHLERHLVKVMSPRTSLIHPARVIAPPTSGTMSPTTPHLERHVVMSPRQIQAPIMKKLIIEPPPITGKTIATPLSGYQSPAVHTDRIVPTTLIGPSISRMASASQGTLSTSGSLTAGAFQKI
mmetsp:Transcript_117023/g.206991  ORF Transcript_117023/g.206991 Transcript_117023/m.206991 type:complete len:992 (-) Transcript_117023:46-3021(-)